MNSLRKINAHVLAMGIVAFTVTTFLSQPSPAVTTEEQLANWPVHMYQGEELEKVREWEKTWVGKKIDKNNIDQVKEFLSEQFYGIYSQPEDLPSDFGRRVDYVPASHSGPSALYVYGPPNCLG